MKREPSIHISESCLAKILLDLDYPYSENVAKQILERAKKYQLSGRKLLATAQKQRKRAENITKSPIEYTMIMAKAIYTVRKSLKHKGIDIAKPGSKDWTIIKDITASALEYCEELEKPIDLGFNQYVRSYLTIIGKSKFNLLALRGKAEQIIAHDKSIQELGSDKNSNQTERAYNRYNYHIVKQTGEILTHYDKMPDKYKCFMEVAKASIKLGITVDVWIDAQFAELEWTKSFPEPGQLIGSKAEERLQKYLYKNKIKLRETPQETTDKEYANKLKNLRKLR